MLNQLDSKLADVLYPECTRFILYTKPFFMAAFMCARKKMLLIWGRLHPKGIEPVC